jgi:hypothetical protein
MQAGAMRAAQLQSASLAEIAAKGSANITIGAPVIKQDRWPQLYKWFGNTARALVSNSTEHGRE